MDARPTRRRETFTSLQLQRASDQLQEAIQSARQHRTMYDSSTHATSVSLLSELSSDVEDEEEEEEEEDADAMREHDDQENRPPHANTQDLHHALGEMEKPTPEQKLRRFMAESLDSSRTSTGRRVGASLSMKDLLASPLRPPREQRDEAKWTQQLAGESESLRGKEKAAVDDQEVVPTAKKAFGDHMERENRKALDMLQHDVEAQARANRALQDQLKQAAHHINGVLERIIGGPIGNCLDDEKAFDLVKVEKVCDEWTSMLAKWKDDVDQTKQRDEQRIAEFQQKMESRICELEQAHCRDRDDLEATIAGKAAEMTDLYDTIESLEEAHAEERKKQSSMQQEYQLQIDRLQMENEDWRMRLHQKATVAIDDTFPSAEAQQHHLLNLIAQLKQSELRELQWEMLFDEQTRAAVQAEERLSMVLEDVNHSESSRGAPTREVPSTHATIFDHHAALADRCTSVAGSATSSELHYYQQRIELLEEQLQDVKEQVNCDHHQFLYEQQKWDLEKKHMGDDVEEVHNVSLKVLKLLLIREKLLKKQETKMQKRLDKVKKDERKVRAKLDAIHECLEAALQECGVALLYVRQLALASTSTQQQGSAALPVKPIKLVRVLKRLKTLQQESVSGWNESTSSTPSPARTSTSTRTSSSTSETASRGR